MHNHFRIRVVEKCGRALPTFAQIREVIDFSVEDDPHRAVFVKHGLVSAERSMMLNAASQPVPCLTKYLRHPVRDAQ